MSYNIIGQKIQTLLNRPLPAGYHEIEFNAKNLSSGIYLYKIEAGSFQDVKKMILRWTQIGKRNLFSSSRSFYDLLFLKGGEETLF